MTYTWKVNMIDGKSYCVETEERNLVDFAISILPRDGKESISLFKCGYSEVINGDSKHLYNSVVVVGSKVASIDYFVDGNVHDKK